MQAKFASNGSVAGHFSLVIDTSRDFRFEIPDRKNMILEMTHYQRVSGTLRQCDFVAIILGGGSAIHSVAQATNQSGAE